jgi:hypothetical protein
MTNLTALRVFGGLMGLVILAMTLPRLINKPVNQFHMDVLRLEWERDPKTVDEILGKLGRQIVLRDLAIDSFLIVPLYVAFFIGLAFTLRLSGSALSEVLFYAIIASIVIAGIADWFENYFTARLVSNRVSGSLIDLKYYACFIKWGFIAVTLLLASIAFLFQGNIWVPLAGFATVTVFGIGFIASRPLTQWGFALMGATLLMIAIFR